MVDNIILHSKVFIAYIVIAYKNAVVDKIGALFYFSFSIGELVFRLLLINVIFSQTSSLGGWDRGDMFLLVGVGAVATGLYYFICGESMWQTQWDIHGGRMDYKYMLPIDAQFTSSIAHLQLGEITSFLVSLSLLTYGIYLSGFHLIHFLILIPMIILAGLIYYSFGAIVTLFTFYMGYPSLTILMFPLEELSKAPVQVFSKFFTALFLSILPMAFIAYVPSAVYLGKLNINFLFYQLLITCAVFYLARKFWNYSMRRYVSVG